MKKEQMKEALKLALEALKKGDYALVNAICEELKQAQPEQEPVVFSCLRCVTPKKCAIHGCCPNTWPAETQERSEQEPVAWMQNTTCGLYVIDHPDEWHCIPLYTTPPQRKPLTDEQKYVLIEKHLGLKKRRNETVIDQYTGLFYAAKPYLDLIDEAAHGIRSDEL